MITDILDDTTYSSRGNSEPLSNNGLLAEGSLGKDLLFNGIWDMVPVPHVCQRRQAAMRDSETTRAESNEPMGDGTTGCRGRLSDDVDLRPIADSKIFVYMSGINKKNATYFFENRSIVLQRAV